MRDFGYSKRGRDVNEAQAEVRAAFGAVVNRRDPGDPNTQRWLAATERFRAAYERVYPETLRLLEQGTKPVSDVDTVDMLDFLEADPIFFRSGYMKEKLLADLKKRRLDPTEIERLQAILLTVVQKRDRRREFLHYGRAAVAVDSAPFRARLATLERSDDPHVSQRARRILATLDGKDAAPKPAAP